MKYLMKSKCFTESKTYIRTFENSKSFAIGDLVKFNSNIERNLPDNIGILEIIDRIYIDDRQYNQLKPIGGITGSKFSWILDKSIRHLTDEEKIEYAAKKYNII